MVVVVEVVGGRGSVSGWWLWKWLVVVVMEVAGGCGSGWWLVAEFLWTPFGS